MSVKKNKFELLTEMVGWLQIVASPLLTGVIIGCVIYFYQPGKTTLIIGIIIAILGLIVGMVWATRIWRKKGTIQFMSRLEATPELDDKRED